MDQNFVEPPRGPRPPSIKEQYGRTRKSIDTVGSDALDQMMATIATRPETRAGQSSIDILELNTPSIPCPVPQKSEGIRTVQRDAWTTKRRPFSVSQESLFKRTGSLLIGVSMLGTEPDLPLADLTFAQEAQVDKLHPDDDSEDYLSFET